MNQQDKNDDAAIAMVGLIAACGLATYFSFSMGEVINSPSAPSERELCKERGGVFVNQKYGPDRCFSKEAFK